MKILAVIPARAGSKGIPNKNIRIIGGHPLIYYSIKNALNSTMITDIIVTTDSEEVKIIAEQMGAKVKWRDANERAGSLNTGRKDQMRAGPVKRKRTEMEEILKEE